MLKINIIKNSDNSYYIQELVFGFNQNIYINGQKIKHVHKSWYECSEIPNKVELLIPEHEVVISYSIERKKISNSVILLMEFAINNPQLELYSEEFLDQFNQWFKNNVEEIKTVIPDEYKECSFELHFIENIEWPEVYIKTY